MRPLDRQPRSSRPASAPLAALTPVAVVAALALPLALPVAAQTGAEAPEIPAAVEECAVCHADPDLELTLGDGSALPLHVDAATYAGSVHGATLVCTDCHAGYDAEHPFGAEFESRRDYVLQAYETCKGCHFETYTRNLESVHYELVREGREDAPLCTDCHGAHDIQDPREANAMISRSCGRCHAEVNETYRASVHGQALTVEDNRDVPGCADCHTSHSVEDPTTIRFRMRSPEICLACHGDAALMDRYDLTAEIGPTYLTDFHGVTATFAGQDEADPRELVVTCVDCHGVHDIASPAVLGEEAMKAQVAETCESCHAGASPEFPAAWLAHYRPSWDHAPLVYAVDLFYAIFIPFVVIGLLLQIALHLYRVALRR